VALVDKYLSISVVSHGQIALVASLLADLAKYCEGLSFECLLTLNITEELPFDPDGFPFPVIVIRNPQPLGFGANHNKAFQFSNGRFYCILNPDIRLMDNPFPSLIECLEDPAVGLVAPLVLGALGKPEDNARQFPSPVKILCKAFGKCRGGDYDVAGSVIRPNWVAGMFMLFRRESFESLNGFDERYFLYYEDVDLCARLRLENLDILLCPESRVVHLAQRASHRNLRYLRWHLQSMLRFFVSTPYWRWQFRRCKDALRLS